MTTSFPESQWSAELNAFTNRNAGRTTVVEEQSTELGAQIAETGYPLRGISYDRRDGRIDIMMGDLEGTEHHVTRSIGPVTAVERLADSAGHDIALRIARDDGQTVLRFSNDCCAFPNTPA